MPAYLGVGLSYRHGRLHKTFFFISPKCDFWAFRTISHIKRVFPYKFSGQPAERQDRFATPSKAILSPRNMNQFRRCRAAARTMSDVIVV